MSLFTRRQVIIGGASAVAAIGLPAAPATAGGMGGGGMGGTTSVIDPPVGAALKRLVALPNETSEAGVFQASIRAMTAPVDVNGSRATLQTYNGQHPGPLVRVRKNQLLRLKFTNALPDDGRTNILGHPTRTTNLHTHGLHVTPGDNANMTHGDNMMVMVMPGAAEEVYEYDLSRHPGGNLNFYHPHIHGCVADQMWAGLSAPLIVEDEVATLDGIEEHVLVLKDITLSGSDPAPHSSQMEYMQGKEGNIVMVNGQVNPRLTIKKGQVQRWRVLNACTARFFKLSLQGHSMYVIGTDGGLLRAPYRVTSVLLSPGERLDLLVRADSTTKTTSFKWLSLPYSRHGMMGSQQVTLMTLTYSGSTTQQPIPQVIDPNAARVDPATVAVAATKTISLSMSRGAGYINGVTYRSHDDCFMTHSHPDTWEIWDVTNNSGMDHPFHHHTNSAQVLSITGGDTGYAAMLTGTAAWKDVTIVPKWGRIRLLMPVHDYSGMAMVHCHIIEHEDIGMMGIWHIGDGPM